MARKRSSLHYSLADLADCKAGREYLHDQSGQGYIPGLGPTRKSELPKQTEDEAAMSLWRWWDGKRDWKQKGLLVEPGYSQEHGLEGTLFHIANGGFRSKRTAGRFRAMGVLPGIADYLLFEPRGNYVGLALELKSEIRGAQSKQQKAFESMVTDRGWLYVLPRGFRAAQRAILDYLAL